MKTATKILLVVVCLLLLTDICWRVWAWSADAKLRAFSNQFKLEVYHTNNVSAVGIKEAKDVSAVGIRETKTGRLLLIDWDYGDGLHPGELSYFSEGTNVLNVYFRTNKPPVYRFIFHGPAKSETWWMNMGSESSFTMQVSYDTNGNRSNFEVLYNNAWYPIERKNEHNGIVINGNWRQLEFTNDAAAIESATNR